MSRTSHYKSRDRYDRNDRNRNERYDRNRNDRNDRRNNQDRRFTKQEQYERNYQYVIRNISENLKRGSYRNMSSLQRDLEKLQNNQFCQEYSQINIESNKQHNDIATEQEQEYEPNYSKNANKKEDIFLPLNKILKYNNTNERREPQTLNHSKQQFSSLSKTQSIQIKTEDDDTIYNFKAYSHIDLDKTGEKDEFAFCFLFQLSNLYKLLSGRERREYRSQLYRKIVADYDSKDLFHKFGYSERRMNRNGMKSAIMRQAPLDLLGQILVMDYFKVNILVYKPDKKQFLTYLQYNENYANVFLKYQHNKFTPMEMISDENGEADNDSEPFYSLKMLNELIERKIINLSQDSVVNPFIQHKLKSLSAYKLADLRDLAENLSIELNKLIGQKEKKKTKKELYDEIKALYEM
jgi:hypothetical protein